MIENKRNTVKEVKVTIGLPTYNGEKSIKKAIESILSQTYTNFQIIISDNASTDSTSVICKEYERKDNRIVYIRHEENRGWDFNFPFVLSKAKSDYFVWLADDDYWESTFLEKNVSILNSNKNVVGSIGLVKFFGVENFQIEKNLVFKIKNLVRRGSNDNHEKYVHVRPAFGDYEKKAETYLRFDQASFVYGLFRTEKVKNRMIRMGHAWDGIFMLNILKEGDLYVVDEVLLHRFVSGVHGGSGYLTSYKKHILPLKGLILPSSNIAYWCLKNIGIKFFLRNLDWFVLTIVYGWYSIIKEIVVKTDTKLRE
jgi:glycosyltransferase involved in cell wall biosynthesis